MHAPSACLRRGRAERLEQQPTRTLADVDQGVTQQLSLGAFLFCKGSIPLGGKGGGGWQEFSHFLCLTRFKGFGCMCFACFLYVANAHNGEAGL